MKITHPKSVRRHLLKFLYDRYLSNPLEMMGPSDFLEGSELSREALMVNIHYLADRNLVELMMGYNPPMFAAVRITADGIDLVENQFEFNLRFPPELDEREESTADILWLVERLVEEAEQSPLDGEARKSLLRDVQYLRDEVARPTHRWRKHVLDAVMGWMAESMEGTGETLSSLATLQTKIKDTMDSF
ncbi:MAG TPA: hypothetical protein PLI09_09995 [Candidatus Hydrogenedentes bacterium]|nr:hypothetical protein [Candidatus Hydrogenedentota bacterium]